MSLDDPYNATVIQRVEVAPGLLILRVVTDEPPPAFAAGQYTILGLRRSAPRVAGADPDDAAAGGDRPDDLIKRAYSIASTSRAGEYLEFYLTLVRSGELSPRLCALRLQDRLFVGRKFTGVFTLARVPADRHVLLVATGTGLAPYMSMLRSDLSCGADRRFVVLHGARYSWDLGYRSELHTLTRLCPNLVYLPVVSRPQTDPTWRGRAGYLQDVLFSGVVEESTGLPVLPGHFHALLCGNPGMIEAATARLVERGFVRDRGKTVGTIHVEEYW